MNLALLPLRGSHEPDAAAMVAAVVLIHEPRHPGANLFTAKESPARLVLQVLLHTEQRLREGVAVADARSGE